MRSRPCPSSATLKSTNQALAVASASRQGRGIVCPEPWLRRAAGSNSPDTPDRSDPQYQTASRPQVLGVESSVAIPQLSLAAIFSENLTDLRRISRSRYEPSIAGSEPAPRPP